MKTYDPLKIIYPCFIQPKLNGIYAELGTDGIFTSRTGKYFPAIQTQDKWKNLHPLVPLCGELYVHGWKLQDIVSAVMPQEPNELSGLVDYYVYDTISEQPQYVRLTQIPSNVNGVTSKLIRSYEESDFYYKSCLDMGFEGAVYRPYLHGDILKRKPFKDAEFECIAVKEGRGKRKGHVGKFILRLNDHQTFNCGGGQVSYKVLRDLFQNPPIGKMITVRYQHTSEAGIPLCAQFMPPIRGDYE